MARPTRGLTTHVLDTARGRPAAGLQLELAVIEPGGGARGRYQITFHVGPYFAAAGMALADPPFLDQVPVRFAIADVDAHYHVPLLVSPFGYVTYRGS